MPHTLFNVTLNTAAITGIQQQGASKNIETLIASGSGALDPIVAGIWKEAPVTTFSTIDLAVALAAIGIDGVAIASATSLGFRDIEGGGDGGDVTVTVPAGLVVLNGIRASLGQVAQAAFSMYSVGALTVATNASLALASAAAAGAWTVGQITINGTDFYVIDQAFELNPRVWFDVDSGSTRPTAVGLTGRAPMITARTRDMDAMAFANAAVTSATLWFKKMASLGPVADGTAVHIGITMTAGVAYCQEGDASHGDAGTCSVAIQPAFDGTDAIAQIDTTSAVA